MLSKKEFTQKLAKKLREARQTKKMSQEELSHRAELYRTYVGHIETARYCPSGYVIYKLITALGIKPSDILPV